MILFILHKSQKMVYFESIYVFRVKLEFFIGTFLPKNINSTNKKVGLMCRAYAVIISQSKLNGKESESEWCKWEFIKSYISSALLRS